MGQVAGQFQALRAGEFLERRSQVHFEDELLVILEMNAKQGRAHGADLFAEETDVLARSPRMENVGREAVRKQAGPGAIHFVKGEHAVILFAQAGPAVVPLGSCDCDAVAGIDQVTREIMHVHRAVRGEIVIENEEDVAHTGRGL